MSQPTPPPGQPGQPEDEPRYGVRLPPDQVPPPVQPNPYGTPPAGSTPPTSPVADPYAGAYGAGGYGTPPSGPGGPGAPPAQGQQPLAAQPPYGGQTPYAAQPPYGGQAPYAPGPYAAKPRNAIGIVSMSLGIASVVLFCLNWLAALIGLSAVITGLVSVNYGKKGLATNSRLGVIGIITGVIGMIAGIGFLVWFLRTPEGQQILRDAGF